MKLPFKLSPSGRYYLGWHNPAGLYGVPASGWQPDPDCDKIMSLNQAISKCEEALEEHAEEVESREWEFKVMPVEEL